MCEAITSPIIEMPRSLINQGKFRVMADMELMRQAQMSRQLQSELGVTLSVTDCAI